LADDFVLVTGSGKVFDKLMTCSMKLEKNHRAYELHQVRPGGILAFQEPCWKTFLIHAPAFVGFSRFSISGDISALQYKH
jgi:hypothetical protein